MGGKEFSSCFPIGLLYAKEVASLRRAGRLSASEDVASTKILGAGVFAAASGFAGGGFGFFVLRFSSCACFYAFGVLRFAFKMADKRGFVSGNIHVSRGLRRRRDELWMFGGDDGGVLDNRLYIIYDKIGEGCCQGVWCGSMPSDVGPICSFYVVPVQSLELVFLLIYDIIGCNQCGTSLIGVMVNICPMTLYYFIHNIIYTAWEDNGLGLLSPRISWKRRLLRAGIYGDSRNRGFHGFSENRDFPGCRGNRVFADTGKNSGLLETAFAVRFAEEVQSQLTPPVGVFSDVRKIVAIFRKKIQFHIENL